MLSNTNSIRFTRDKDNSNYIYLFNVQYKVNKIYQRLFMYYHYNIICNMSITTCYLYLRDINYIHHPHILINIKILTNIKILVN